MPGVERKVFSFEEARQLLPLVRERTRQAIDEMGAIEIDFDDADDDALRRTRVETDAARILGAWALDIQALGIEVKGPWLVDFDSGAGYYCWKWPEESLEFFHEYSEGFAGRVRLQ